MGLFDRTRRAKEPLYLQSYQQALVTGADTPEAGPDAVTVRCTEGPTPETVGQLLACQARGIVDLTLVLDGDGVPDPEIVELIETEMLDLAEQHGWTAEHVTIVRR